MQRTPFDQMNCSIARTLDVVGEWWTPLIVRDLAFGISRFDALQRNLGISRKVLTQRLASLVDHEVVQRVPYQQGPERFDYRLTQKGVELAMALLALQAWGDKWAFDGVGPIKLTHTTCGHQTHAVIACAECGEALGPTSLVAEINPASDAKPEGPELAGALQRLAEARAAFAAESAAGA